MAIDMASVYAARYRKQPDMLRAAVMGQSPDPKLDSYTALNALRLVKEADMMDMAGQAQQPTSAPSIVAQNLAPPPMQQGLGAMVPGAMGQAPQGMAPQGQAPQQRAPMPQPTMQAASGGLAGMYTPEEDFAEGGIVAFQRGGLNSGEDTYNAEAAIQAVNNAAAQEQFGMEKENWPTITGDEGEASSTILSRAEEALNKYMNFAPKEMTEKEQEAFLDRYMARVKKAGGEDIYAPEIARGAQDEADRAKARRVGEAGAYFTAAGKILKGRNLAEGASEALPAFGSAINEVEKLDQAAKQANARAQFLLKDAQRKERMGDARGAQAALAEARKFQQDANRAQGDKLRYAADISARTVGYNRQANKGAGSGPKWQEQVLQSNIDYLKTTQKPKQGESPEAFDARIRKQASDIVAPLLKSSYSTSENAPNKQAAAVAPVQQRVDAAVAQDIADFKLFSPEGAAYRRALKAKAPEEAARLLREAEKSFRATHERTQGLTGAGEAAPGTAANPIVIK
jgi:hypothetical protein